MELKSIDNMSKLDNTSTNKNLHPNHFRKQQHNQQKFQYFTISTLLSEKLKIINAIKIKPQSENKGYQ